MNIQNASIGLEVVRAKGDYVVGRVGIIEEVDTKKNRVKVSWGTWVSISVVEPTSIPYEIIDGYMQKNLTWINPKYKTL
jgi:predicted metal-dependent hydrolase